MAIKQLTVFVENKRGRLAEITGLLAENKIDMSALSIADTKEFGILRLIVNDTDKALGILRDNGFLVQITEVVGLKVPDKAGELARALEVIDKAGINMEYLYAFISRDSSNAYIALRVADNPSAEKELINHGFEIL